MLFYLPFVKYQGAGNHFILLSANDLIVRDLLEVKSGLSHAIARLCDPHYGIGADGLIVVAPDDDSRYMFAMIYYNADGGRAAMCGNGARCAYHFAYSRGYASAEGFFRTDAGPVYGRLIDDGEVAIDLPDVHGVQIDPSTGGYILNTGVPHLVIEVSPQELAADDLMKQAQGHRSRVNPETGGVNVDFFARTSEGFRMRTYERGVEGETLACGTGATAVAIVLSIKGVVQESYHLATRGGVLTVQFARGFERDTWQDIRLKGSAEETFRGIVRLAF